MALTAYQNFDLLITRSGEEYRAFVVDAPGGDADATFALPFTADELDFLGNLAGVRRGNRPAKGGVVPDLKELGGLLYGAVFQGKMVAVLATSLEKAEQEQIGLRLRLRFSEETSELATLPWEILYDPVQERFLALSESSPILRYLSLPKARPTLLVKPPLRVLAVLVSPPGYEELDVEREWQVLETAMAGLVGDGKFVLERLERPTFAALQERLLGDDLHILHFVGHGVYDDTAGAGALILADADGNAQQISGEELATLLHNHRSLRLVYLNACEGALSSHLSVFSGVAQTLVQQGVPAAVAMQAEISDTAAIELSRLFYSALAAGYPVDAALTQARVAIASRSAEWAIPVLFSRSPDNRLFDVVEVLPAPDCPYPGMVPFTEKQADVFFGRDTEIADGVERLRQHPFLTVIGPSGSGKSSLIYAGIIPALRKSKRFGAGEWDVRILRPGAKPLTALAEALAASPEQLASATFNQRTLLFVDQFEELFTLAETAEAQRFLDALNALIGKPNLYVLLTVRADFYPDLMACSLWQPIRANRLELTPLGDEELRAAILQPAAQVGVTIDEVLVERLVADATGESGALPLVQETLVLLWEKVERRHLALQAYTDMADGKRNGLQVAIDRRANIVYENLPDKAKPIARRIFLRLIQFGEGRADTRRQQTVADLRASGDDPALFDRILAILTASRLLTTSGEEGSARRVDVSHEALIGGWATLQRWIGEKREAERTRRRLEEKAGEWVRLEKSGGLLDEYQVQEAEVWLHSDYSGDLGYSQALLDLVTASRAALAQVTAEKAASERTRQRSRIFAGGLTLAILTIALVGWFWWQATESANLAQSAEATAVVAQVDAEKAAEQEIIQRQKAEESQRKAEEQAGLAAQAEATAVAAKAEIERLTRGIRADQLTANMLKVADEDPSLALLLAVEGLRVQSDFTTTVVITEPISPEATAPVTHTVVVSETVMSSAQTNVHELLNRPRGLPLPGDYPVVFSPDGRWMAQGTRDRKVLVWNTLYPNDKPVELRSDGVGTFGLSFSPDGRYLTSAGGWDFDVVGAAVWDLHEPGNPPIVLPNAIRPISFSPDGRWIATGVISRTGSTEQNSDGTATLTTSSVTGDTVVALWSLADRTSPPAVPTHVLKGHTDQLDKLVFSQDSRWLATTGLLDARVYLWDLNNPGTGRLIYNLSGIIHQTTALAFSPDNRWLATAPDAWPVAEVGNMFAAVLFDITDPQAKPAVILEPGRVDALAFSPDGSWLAVAVDRRDGVGTVDLWPMDGNPDCWGRWNEIGFEGCPQLIELTGHEGRISSLAFSPDEQWLASGSYDKTVRVWNMNATEPEAEPITLRGHEQAVDSVSFSPDGHWLVTSAEFEKSRLWEVQALAATPAATISPGLFSAQIAASSPDGRWLAVASGLIEGARNRDSAVLLWDTRVVAQNTGADPIALTGHSAGVDAVVFSPDNRWLATAAGDNAARLWDLTELNAANPITRSVELKGHQGVAALVFSRDSRWLATGSSDGSAWLWDIAKQTKGANEASMELIGHADGVSVVAFSLDGHWLATGSRDDTVRLWDVQASNPAASFIELRGHIDDINALAFSPDGRWLATSSISGVTDVHLWNVSATGPSADPILLKVPGGSITSLLFSPDGRWLVTTSFDGTAHMWDMHAHNPGSASIPLRGHTSTVWTSAFSADGRWLATGSSDDTARMWEIQALIRDPDTTPVVVRGTGNRGHVSFVGVNGQWLATSSYGSTRLWDWRVEGMISTACPYATRNMTADEWKAYFPTRPYRRTCAEWPGHRSITQNLSKNALTQAERGDIGGAVESFNEALSLDPGLATNPQAAKYWNSLCWYGVTWNQAALVLDACETAVALVPDDIDVYDSRGLARALTGDIDGAIADLEYVIVQKGWFYASSRAPWLEALRGGEAPAKIFDASILAKLRLKPTSQVGR